MKVPQVPLTVVQRDPQLLAREDADVADAVDRYVDQYGDVYAPLETGKKIANMVFVQKMRDKQKAYLQRLFATLGTDFYGVRLGGGWYGELNYPEATYGTPIHSTSQIRLGAFSAGGWTDPPGAGRPRSPGLCRPSRC